MYTNDLINETSPYLLQHAHNPVNWKPWNDDTLLLAQNENKLILISVGYAACHWCHVMEKETFENEEAAGVMNNFFINIKVDREERPDVDQIYMNAVQIMTGTGGWPMNVIALPDGRPFWGGTYFKKEKWIDILKQISEIYKKDPEKIIEYANNLEQGLKRISLAEKNNTENDFSIEEIENSVNNWSQYFDYNYGGNNRAPKFMMPVTLDFLLKYSHATKNENISAYVFNTLTKIAFGGVYDHIGGGFARYSIDIKWHVPHFEKMLYDNAQLVSVYSKAYSLSKNTLYKTIVKETLEFVERELMSDNYIFYSSLDADSLTLKNELKEGAFYVWKKDELKNLLGKNYNLFKVYYNINDFGYWEENNYVLIRNKTEEELATEHALPVQELQAIISECKSILFKERLKRSKPGLDDKSLTSWNALMLKGYLDAYKAFADERYLEIALKNADFIIRKQIKENGGLLHNYKKGKSTINGFLEDYSTVIDAFITLHEATLDEKWLKLAKNLTNYCFDYFFDDKSGMFFFTSSKDKVIVTRTIEKSDNVIPASNSLMAHNLFRLSFYFDNPKYYETSSTMLNNVRQEFEDYGYSHANWLNLMLNFTRPFYEIAISGKNAIQNARQINTHYLPNVMITGSTTESDLPLLRNRYIKDKTLLYVCVENTCKLPFENVDLVLKEVNK
ncbi:thioredoxin domain-containing protein [Abyssalbus ytuae]|uniref:Thioredoxin domain-containing protein n=1 Tax=Abyssalbus ytuae TaxID=2926907 RepID=A0A9E6ZQA4_9FLAO|nr:thioredoxin domain-containing protein [Abyssalbus ytuae]UOB18964.1 thioredoxin domain-containing protein [Abyssalbus ytuae]